MSIAVIRTGNRSTPVVGSRHVKDILVTIDKSMPRFDELGMIKALGLRHSWGVFGADDNLGTINKITSEARLRGLGAVQTGDSIGLSLPLSEPDPPMYNRPRFEHVIFTSGRNSHDDLLNNFHPQSSTQWDALNHVRCREFGFYTGLTDAPEPGGQRLGIDHWARTGIVSRGVLLDLPKHFASTGHDYHPFSGETVTSDVLSEVAKAQGIELQAGDILCVHFGWTAAYFDEGSASRPKSKGRSTFAGLEGSEDMARYLWDSNVAAIVCDNPAIEVSPGDPTVGSLHRRLLPLLGMALGELFDFRELAPACARRGRWDFLFMAAPLYIPGGVGSPGNALALI